jgi:branched-chain amino acid transport system ATP-binding protein
VLEVRNIEVRYGRTTAVRDVGFSVTEGEFICIVGPNGAGKSTTMMTIAGGLKPAAGTIRLAGQSIVGLVPEQIARLGISLVPEGRHVFSQLTVEENIRLGSDMRKDRDKIAADLERVLEHFPFLRQRRSTPGGKLSGGEQQQLVIARALMTRPKLMLVDEPSLGLAPKIVDRVYEILKQLQDEGNTLLVVEQSTHRALEVADRIYVMRNGRIVLEGRSADLTDAQLEQAYFGFEKPLEKTASF